MVSVSIEPDRVLDRTGYRNTVPVSTISDLLADARAAGVTR